ncbi:hypothetical protein DFH07DRAFT_1067796 [Mycena maculata]|uniref:Uncharacterized protein n=1 Tax=Mycena maculata TaxID=230809 RepID=A0AAD7HGB5_9AGAR|nr:hypothetical protein DFH07DRAFT_1067796 [Mycena maculata]
MYTLPRLSSQPRGFLYSSSPVPPLPLYTTPDPSMMSLAAGHDSLLPNSLPLQTLLPQVVTSPVLLEQLPREGHISEEDVEQWRAAIPCRIWACNELAVVTDTPGHALKLAHARPSRFELSLPRTRTSSLSPPPRTITEAKCAEALEPPGRVLPPHAGALVQVRDRVPLAPTRVPSDTDTSAPAHGVGRGGAGRAGGMHAGYHPPLPTSRPSPKDQNTNARRLPGRERMPFVQGLRFLVASLYHRGIRMVGS